jgi:hypothetical protein
MIDPAQDNPLTDRLNQIWDGKAQGIAKFSLVTGPNLGVGKGFKRNFVRFSMVMPFTAKTYVY